MFGWRARIGFISPTPGGVPTSLVEMEMVAPEGVAFVPYFLDGPASLDLDVLTAMGPQVESATKAITAKGGIDLVLMGGAPVVLANGPDECVRRMEQAGGVPATTNVHGLVNGLRRLGASRVVVVAPYYPDHLMDMVRSHLESSGLELLTVLGGAGVDFRKHKEHRPEDTYRKAKAAMLAAPEAEALVLVGGGAPTHTILQILETDIGRPVVANNLASLWNALTMVSVRQPISGYGTLLTCF